MLPLPDDHQVDQVLAEAAGRLVGELLVELAGVLLEGHATWRDALGAIAELGAEAERVLLGADWNFLNQPAAA